MRPNSRLTFSLCHLLVAQVARSRQFIHYTFVWQRIVCQGFFPTLVAAAVGSLEWIWRVSVLLWQKNVPGKQIWNFPNIQMKQGSDLHWRVTKYRCVLGKIMFYFLNWFANLDTLCNVTVVFKAWWYLFPQHPTPFRNSFQRAVWLSFSLHCSKPHWH